MNKRTHFVEKIVLERQRQFNLPGSEFDLKNSPNDWIAIASRYIAQDCRRGGRKPTKDDLEDSFVKAAAVILAALEHLDEMEKENHFIS